MRQLLPAEALWLRVEGLLAELKRWPQSQLSTQTLPEKAGEHNMDYRSLPDLAVEVQRKAPMDKLRRFYEQFDGRVIFSVESEGLRKSLSELLARVKILPKSASINVFYRCATHKGIDLRRRSAGERVSRRQQDNRRTINADS
ncbi:MAG: Transcription-repair-coupling factor [Sodalis sp.]|nr:MAG: Transcription-repair-coupling factor [Sodalis sp.]